MPKIIKDLENRLIEEAKNQIEESGYGAMTIRSVAKACGVGVGTVYNYFRSKDELLATYMLNDWKECIRTIEEVSVHTDAPREVVLCMYDQLTAFAKRHQSVFHDQSAATNFSRSFNRYHALLRGQIALPLRKFCKDDFAAEFIAEALLSWTMAGRSFDDIYGMLEKLF